MALTNAKTLYEQAKDAFTQHNFEEATKLSKDAVLDALNKLSNSSIETIKSALDTLELDDRILHVVSFFNTEVLAEEASKALRYAKEVLVHVEESLNSP